MRSSLFFAGIKTPVIGLIFAMAVFSCAEKEFDPNDPKKSYSIAKEPYDGGHFDEAIKRLGEYKSRFPYSQFATDAELLIADSQFQLDRFQEAAASYDTFVKLHPRHPKADFALYRVAESYWQDAPEAVSREQEYTLKAVAQWQDVIQKHPSSEYAAKSKDMLVKGHRRLAESIQFVARFYCRREIWHSCAFRYTQLLDRYPDQKDMTREALDQAALALEKVADAKEKDPASDKNLYHRTMTAQQIREKAANFRRLLKG